MSEFRTNNLTYNNPITFDGSGNVVTYSSGTTCTPMCWEQVSAKEVWKYGRDGVLFLTIAIVIALILVLLSRIFYSFITDKKINKSFMAPMVCPDATNNIMSDVFFILGVFIVGAIFGLVWFIGLPLLLLVGLAFGLRYIVRMKKKLDKIK